MFQGGDTTGVIVAADSVVVQGLVFEGVEASATEDRAAILLRGIRGCRIEDNEIRGAFFGIYAMRAAASGSPATGSSAARQAPPRATEFTCGSP